MYFVRLVLFSQGPMRATWRLSDPILKTDDQFYSTDEPLHSSDKQFYSSDEQVYSTCLSYPVGCINVSCILDVFWKKACRVLNGRTVRTQFLIATTKFCCHQFYSE